MIGGNIGQPIDALPSQYSKYGKAGKYSSDLSESEIGKPFQPDNFRILHSYKGAGVIRFVHRISNTLYLLIIIVY